MRKFSALLLLGAIASAVLSGCSAAESGVPTDSETTEASAETAADVPENDIDYMAEGLNAVAAFKEKVVCLDNIEYVENSEKIEVMSPFSDVSQLSGQYTVNGIADYNELVDFMAEVCTENYARKIFDEKGFINRDGKIYYYPVDMLLDMYAYDESKIVSYKTNGNSVTYFCEAAGTYDGGEPLDILEYTFSVSFDGEKPVISDCTYDGHCNYWLLCYTLPLDGNAENSEAVRANPNDFIPLTEPVGTSGLEVTVEELLPIAKTARDDMYLIEFGGETFDYKDGHYLDYGGDDFYAFLNSLYDIFAEETNIAEDYISSLKCYDGVDNELLLSTKELVNFKEIDEDIFNIKGSYDKITIDGGAGSNPTYLYNEFEIIDRTETTLTLKNTAYYNEENDEPIQVFEYNMVLENGTWKFLNFERWF